MITFYAIGEEFEQIRGAIYELPRTVEALPRTKGRIQRRMFVMEHVLQAVSVAENKETNTA